MHRLSSLLASILLLATAAAAQAVSGSLAHDLADFVKTPAPPGYEQPLADHIAQELQAYAPTRDNLGDVIVRLGPAAASAAPARLLVASLDQPGYAVSAITPDGYLRLQTLPTRLRLPLFNELRTAQPVLIGTTRGTFIHGIMAGFSVHLQPGRRDPPDPNDLDNLYVDLGATTAAQVRAAGVDILSPVVPETSLATLAAGQLSGWGIGDRFGAAALVEVLRTLDPAKLAQPVEIAFVTQQWTAERGLARVMQQNPDATVTYVGRTDRPLRAKVADKVGLPIAWPNTPAETISGHDLLALIAKLQSSLGQSPTAAALPQPERLPNPPIPAGFTTPPTPTSILKALVPLYGVNPHEQSITAAIRALLPPWAHPITDEAGNLSLHWGDASPTSTRLLFIAHQDEIGFDVASISPEGLLALRSRGGGERDFYLGHPILVHTGTGMRPGVTELPAGWQTPGFKLTTSRAPILADVGARSAAEVAALGIAVGDSVTIPKQYRPLLGHRASARAFDDRVGDAALIAAAWALGPSLPGRDITFAWSVGEEIGLVGAKAMAQRLAAAGREPTYVFAVDTFVSSDSPLESHRFADTPIGAGFVIRAIDDSSLAPWPLARRMQALARANKIPVQLGATGGGNDGSVFPPYGSIDLPLGWPLRYSHSPGEVIDTRDLDSLSHMLTALAHSW